MLESLFGTFVPAFQTGSPKPRLERTRTIEIGADGTVGGSATVGVTAFLSRSANLWGLGVPTPSGNATLEQNAAMENRGVEALISTPLLDRARIKWTTQLSVAVMRNRVTKLPIPLVGASGSAREGYSYGGVWAHPYTYQDANQDGIIARNEVQGSLEQVYVGPGLPTFESSLSSELELPRGLILTALFDYRGGNRVVDRIGERRCVLGICRGAQDPPLRSASRRMQKPPAGVSSLPVDS